MDEIEAMIEEVTNGLDERGIPYKNIRRGIMIETPAAVMISRELARRVDFLSLEPMTTASIPCYGQTESPASQEI